MINRSNSQIFFNNITLYQRYVCQITCKDYQNGRTQTGIGLLIGRGLILTAYHVLQLFIKNPKTSSVFFKFIDAEIIHIDDIQDIEIVAQSPSHQINQSQNVNIQEIVSINSDFIIIDVSTKFSALSFYDEDYRGFISLANYQVSEPSNRDCILLLPEYFTDGRSSIRNYLGTIHSTADISSPAYFYDINTCDGDSGAPIFCVRTSQLLCLHSGRWPLNNRQEPYGISIAFILQKIQQSNPSSYTMINNADLQRDNYFPILIRDEVPVLNRKFILSLYKELIEKHIQLINIFGPPDSGKTFCREIFESIYKKEKQNSDLIRLYSIWHFSRDKPYTAEQILKKFYDLIKNICSEFEIRENEFVKDEPGFFHQDPSKLKRTISSGVSQLCSLLNKKKKTKFIFLIDSEKTLTRQMENFFFSELFDNFMIFPKKNIKIVLFSNHQITSYQNFEFLCDKDIQNFVRYIDLNEYPISTNHVKNCLRNLVHYLPEERKRSFEEQVLSNLDEVFNFININLEGQGLSDRIDSNNLAEVSNNLSFVTSPYIEPSS